MEELARMLEALAGMEKRLDKIDEADPGYGKTMSSDKNTVDREAKLAFMDGQIAGLEKLRDSIEAAEPEAVDWAGAFTALGHSVDALAQESANFATAVEHFSKK